MLGPKDGGRLGFLSHQVLCSQWWRKEVETQPQWASLSTGTLPGRIKGLVGWVVRVTCREKPGSPTLWETGLGATNGQVS